MKKIVEMGENEEPSTGIADELPPVLINSGMITPDEWCILDEGGYAKMMLQMFAQVIHGSRSVDNTLAPNIGSCSI